MPRRTTSDAQEKYLVTLDNDERQQLEALLHRGTHATRKVTRARILLKAAEAGTTPSRQRSRSGATVERLRQRFVEEGLGALEERPRPGAQSKLDAKAEARLIAEAWCGTGGAPALDLAPAGRSGGGPRLSRVVFIRERPPCLKKTVLKPWLKKQWCIPEVGAEFVAAMEDVLEVYAEPYDPTRPKVNFDETTKQLIQETRQPLPAQPGRPQR